MLRAGGATGPGTVVGGVVVVVVVGGVVGVSGGGPTMVGVVAVGTVVLGVVVVVVVLVVLVVVVVVLVVVVVVVTGTVVVVVVVLSAAGWAPAAGASDTVSVAVRAAVREAPMAARRAPRHERRWRPGIGWSSRREGVDMSVRRCIGTKASRVEHELAVLSGGVGKLSGRVLRRSAVRAIGTATVGRR